MELEKDEIRMRLIFKGDVKDRFCKLQQKTGNSGPDVIKEALKLYEWAVEQHLKGFDIRTSKDNVVNIHNIFADIPKK